MRTALPLITPMRLSRAKKPFNGQDWIFELKHDGFRALAHIENGTCRQLGVRVLKRVSGAANLPCNQAWVRQNTWIQQHGLAVKYCLSWAQAPKLTDNPLSAAAASLGRGGTGTNTAVCPTYPSYQSRP